MTNDLWCSYLIFLLGMSTGSLFILIFQEIDQIIKKTNQKTKKIQKKIQERRTET